MIFGKKLFDRAAYPAADPALFIESARQFDLLFADAHKVIEKVISGGDFARQLMDHAQQNEKEKALKLLTDIGLNAQVDLRYTPDGLSVILMQKDGCCQLVMKLRWQ